MAIASCLVDTNILLRITRRSDPQHKVVDTALARLAGQGSTLHYTHQNIAELWNAMTRPGARNVWAYRRRSRTRSAGHRIRNESIAGQRGRLPGVEANCCAVWRVGSSSARCALSGGNVRACCQLHTHHERDRFQPFQGPRSSASGQRLSVRAVVRSKSKAPGAELAPGAPG